jgi:hypothetical protein
MAKEAVTRAQAEERGLTERPRSGFARPGYWDEIDPDTGISRREMQRQKAQQMHESPHPDDPSRRHFGGPQPNSGPPRYKSAREVIAEESAKQGTVMARKLTGMLSHKSPMVQLSAIKQFLEIEEKVDAHIREDERELRRMNNPQLDDEFGELLITIGRRGGNAEAQVVTEAEVVEPDSDDDGD